MAAIEQNKSIVRRFWEEVFNGRKLTLIDELFTTDWVYHGVAGRKLYGQEGLKQFDFQLPLGISFGSQTAQSGLQRGERLSPKEGEGVMKEFNFQPEDDLQKAIFEIIASYREIKTIDIWFELGENERFRSAVSRSEVNEALSRLEGRKLIRRGEDEKWRLA